MTTAIQSVNERIISLFGKFQKLRDAGLTARLSGMQTFLASVADHSYLETRFNLLNLCRVGTDEVKHSAILAWMLDSTSGHGQGNLFLNAFLKAACIPFDAGNTRCKVRTEFCVSEAVVDILVYQRNELLIYVENKVLASEGDSQIDREFRDMRKMGIGLHVPVSRQYAVFLTPDGWMPSSGDASNWKTLSYTELAQEIQGVISEGMDSKLRDFIQDWVEAVQTWEVQL